MKDAQIRARTDSELKSEVEAIFDELGLTASEAINIFYKQVKLLHGLPFPVRIPSQKTLQAMRDAEQDRNLERFDSSDAMFEG